MPPPVLRPEVRTLRLEGDPRLVLWQQATGRHLRVDPEALEEPSPALAKRLAELRLTGPLGGLGALYPCPSRWVLSLPEDRGVLHPLPMQRGPGGYPFALLPLTEGEWLAWRLCNGARTTAQVALRSGVALDALLGLFWRLTDPTVQALQLRDAPARAREPALEQLVAPSRPPNARPPGLLDAWGATALGAWHEQIADADTHFDEGETTFAHTFAEPHPALGGRRYGEALALALAREGARLDLGPVLEIGPGTGELCRDLRPALGVPPDAYWRLDRSPALLAAQEARNPGTRSLEGDATAAPLPDASVGLVVCNEVIADLRAARDPEGWALTPLEGQTWFNTGAFALVRELWRVLRPGGLAFVSEFGAEDELPTETTQLDHPEVSIAFGQLAEVARGLGFTADLHPLAGWLGVDTSARWLARSSFEGLRARLAWDGEGLASRAWTPETLRLPFAVEGVRWVPLTEDGPGPVVTRLCVLILRKPQGPG